MSAGQENPSQDDDAFGVTQVEAEGPDPVPLGTAGNYTILAKSGISTVPNSDVTGNIGVSPISSTALTGFGLELDSSGQFSTSDQVDGQVHAADYADPTPELLTQTVSDMELAYTDAAGRDPDITELGDGDIGGQTIGPGTYFWSTDVLIDDDITLEGGPDDTWIFQIEGDLTMASDTVVELSGGARVENIIWQVGGGAGATIGTNSIFAGIVLSATGINILTGATAHSCLYAQTDVNLQMATVTGCTPLALNVETSPATEVNDSSATLHGELTDLGDFEEGTVYFEYREVGTEEWLTTDSQTRTEEGTFSTEIDGLDPDTEYEFRAVVEANGERDIGEILQFVTFEPGEPNVETQAATDVNGSTATLNGNLSDLGDYEDVDVSFEWRAVADEDWTATDTQTLTETGPFSAEITGLEAGTDYEFRAVAEANDVTVVGGTLSFTKPDPDEVGIQTLPATDVNETSAILNGTVSDLGGFKELDVYFEWREVGDEDWIGTDPQTISTIGPFSAEIEGLETGTDYEYRAVADADGELLIGNLVTFPKLEPGALAVTTLEASDVNGESATLNAELIDLGDHEEVTVYFEWRELGDEDWIATDAQTLTETGLFSDEIEGLETGTEYEFRAVAEANDERVVGAILRAVKAEPGEPDVVTQAATDVNGASATLNADLTDLGDYEEVDVYFEWREADETEWMATDVQTLSEIGPFSEEIDELEIDTEYWFRAISQVNDTRILGGILTFTKLAPDELAVETEDATDVNESTATLNGELTEMGDHEEVDVFFEWREVGQVAWNPTEVQILTEVGSFDEEIAGLETSKEYEFRTVAQASDFRVIGTTLSFRKLAPDELTVETEDATDVNESTATLHGDLIGLGPFEEVCVFFKYRVVGADEWLVTDKETRTETGPFSATVTDLETGAEYEFRACTKANESEACGEILQFTKEEDITEVFWQVDFGAGEEPPIPPHYWPNDGVFALGNSNGVTENPSHRRMQTDGQLGDVTIETGAFTFDDDDEPTEVTIEFSVDEGGSARYLHLAVFILPGPFDEDEIDEQELYQYTSAEFAGGDSGTFTVELPQA